MSTKQDYFYGLGRRKSATVRAWLKGGKGVITMNGKPMNDYLANDEALMYEVMEPLRLLQKTDSFDISLKLEGGGHNAQIDASKLAIAKALSVMNEDLRSTLKKAGLLKRDPREKERKKPGLRGARRKEQFSKR